MNKIIGSLIIMTAANLASLSVHGDNERKSFDNLSITLTGQSLLQADPRVANPGVIEIVRPLLPGDVVFTNFETTIKEEGDSLDHLTPVHGSGGHFAPPGSLNALQEMGFDLLAMSNNHSYDFGERGVLNTLARAKEIGMINAGIGENLKDAAAPAYLETPKGTIALVSAASGYIVDGAAATAAHPGINELHLEGGVPGEYAGTVKKEDKNRVLSSIREAREKADIVISYLHNHAYDEFFHELMMEQKPGRYRPPNWVKTWSREQIEAGADIIVVQGAPVLQGIDVYEGKPIFYGMGNFIFQLPPRSDYVFGPEVWRGAVATVNFDEGNDPISISLVPIRLNKDGRGNGELAVATRGLPVRADIYDSETILNHLFYQSENIREHFIINGDKAVIDLKAAVVEQ